MTEKIVDWDVKRQLETNRAVFGVDLMLSIKDNGISMNHVTQEAGFPQALEIMENLENH